MLAAIAIPIMLLATVAMMIAHRARPNFAYNWLIAVSGALLGLPLILAAVLRLPQSIRLPAVPYMLLVDDASWPFAAAVGVLVLSTLLSAATYMTRLDWPSWAGSLAISGFGLLAAVTGSPLTLLAAWVALDIVELAVFLGNIRGAGQSRRVAAGFAARSLGVFLALWGIVTAPSGWSREAFSTVPESVFPFLVLAAGLRLGVLPLNLPFTGELTLPRGLRTALRLVPAAGNLVLLVRIAPQTPPSYALILCVFAAGSALIGAFIWAALRDEAEGIPYWLLGTAGLAVCGSLLGKPEAAVSWGATALICGGLLSVVSGQRLKRVVGGFVLLSVSSLPFTPNWGGTELYSIVSSPPTGHSTTSAVILSLIFFLTQALLMAGCLRHVRASEDNEPVERWVWLSYILGSGLLFGVHYLTAAVRWLPLRQVGAASWVGGALAAVITAGLWYANTHMRRTQIQGTAASALRKIFILEWLYNYLWLGYRLVGRITGGITSLLEGQGGVLWAFVLLSLLFTLLQQRIPGG